MSRHLVIFGAAVRPDGTPSGSLRRRVEAALAADRPGSIFLPTGGLGRHPPTEAEAMRRMLAAAGVAPERILIEDRARDTLESVGNCDALLQADGARGTVVVCTSDYHQRRCAALFRALGYTVELAAIAPDRPHLGTAKWFRYRFKEAIVTPYDLVLLRWRMMNRGRAVRPGSPSRG